MRVGVGYRSLALVEGVCGVGMLSLSACTCADLMPVIRWLGLPLIDGRTLRPAEHMCMYMRADDRGAEGEAD